MRECVSVCVCVFVCVCVCVREYAKIANKDIEDALKSEMSGDLLRGFLAIGECVCVRIEGGRE